MRMKITAAALALALVGSNMFWFYNHIDLALAQSHPGDAARDECEALNQALTILDEIGADVPSERILAAATQAAEGDKGFDKDGSRWVGKLGFKVSEGRLIEVERAWSASACELPESAPNQQ